jgi:hypothetical protein
VDGNITSLYFLAKVVQLYSYEPWMELNSRLYIGQRAVVQQNTISTDCGIHYTISQGTVVKGQSSTAVKETCGH